MGKTILTDPRVVVCRTTVQRKRPDGSIVAGSIGSVFQGMNTICGVVAACTEIHCETTGDSVLAARIVLEKRVSTSSCIKSPCRVKQQRQRAGCGIPVTRCTVP